MINRALLERVPRADIEQLGEQMCLDDLPTREKVILIDALFPTNPIDNAEGRRIAILALLLWLSARKHTWIDQIDLFDAARELPDAFRTALDGWLDYQIRDVIAVTHETVMDAVMAEVDSLLARRRAPALASDVVATLLSATDEHNDALRLIGLLADGETVERISFAEMSDRVRPACQNRQTYENRLRRWHGGLLKISCAKLHSVPVLRQRHCCQLPGALLPTVSAQTRDRRPAFGRLPTSAVSFRSEYVQSLCPR